MAGTKKTLFDNAEKRVKTTLFEGDFAYATSDGQVFDRANTLEKRKAHAQNHAFRFLPALEIKKIEGGKKVKEVKS